MIEAIILLISIAHCEPGHIKSAAVSRLNVFTSSRLITNESIIDELNKDHQLEIDDPRAVLSFVLRSIPDNVNIYPTENYYYFKFFHHGVIYAGNIRLDAADRDDGVIHFTYFRDVHDKSQLNMRTIHIDYNDDLLMERLDSLTYRVTFDGKVTVFNLNDLSEVKPLSNHIRPDEVYIGSIFDESGIQFFLVFNNVTKNFLYILNDIHRVQDQMVKTDISQHIIVGLRTRFAFYKDHNLERFILIGVVKENVWNNNYYDGPFDQLPDNFIDGETFGDAFRLSNPTFPFAIDRFGKTSSTTRVLIRPYALYEVEDDLYHFDQCAKRFHNSEMEYYKCFDIND